VRRAPRAAASLAFGGDRAHARLVPPILRDRRRNPNGATARSRPACHRDGRRRIVSPARCHRAFDSTVHRCTGNVCRFVRPTREAEMAIRLVVTITAAPGKGSELAQGYKARCAEVMKEPGCDQFEV